MTQTETRLYRGNAARFFKIMNQRAGRWRLTGADFDPQPDSEWLVTLRWTDDACVVAGRHVFDSMAWRDRLWLLWWRFTNLSRPRGHKS